MRALLEPTMLRTRGRWTPSREASDRVPVELSAKMTTIPPRSRWEGRGSCRDCLPVSRLVGKVMGHAVARSEGFRAVSSAEERGGLGQPIPRRPAAIR